MPTPTTVRPAPPGPRPDASDADPRLPSAVPSIGSAGVSLCAPGLLLAATAGGIAIDRALAPLETASWVTLALAGVSLACIGLRHRAISTWLLLVGIAALAGGWHHFRWNDRATDDLAAGAVDRPAPAWVRGVIVERLGLRQTEGYAPGDPARLTTRMVVDLERLSDGSRWWPASGRAMLTVLGDRTDLPAGMPIEAAGVISGVPGPLNPGEFDYREFLRAKGIRLRLMVDNPDGISFDPSGSTRPIARWLGRVRDACRSRLIGGLDAATEPLAAALILGQREEIDPEVNDAFARTGTTHLLAISGLQLQALAFALGWIFRLLGLPRRLSYGGVGVLTIAYALLVGLAPSVVRSAVMTCTFCLAALVARPTRPGNTLALAGLVTLWWNPFFLYDVGCQLSFLAIACLIWLVPLARAGLEATRAKILGPRTALQELERHYEPRWRRLVRALLSWLGLGVLTSLVVWLAALPLVAFRFHLVSPIGVLLNLPLIPLTSIALLLGAAGMGLGMAWAPLGVPALLAADLLLRATGAIVSWGVSLPGGHGFVAGPAWGSVLAFYLLLGSAVLVTVAARGREAGGVLARIGRVAPWLMAVLVLLPGWLVTWPGRAPTRPEGDVLAVGHGLAVLLRLPDGSALLYDCGRMGDPGVGRRIIAPALWSRGLNRIDSVMLSHADQDHYNGLPDLMDRFRIGEIVIPPGFARDQNPGAEALLRDASARGITVLTISAPARWNRGDTTFSVLHPSADWSPDSPDNARSLVLDVSHEGRHLLLTGDLDQPGTIALTSHAPPAPVDLMLSPHHGGKSANTSMLYDWAQPRSVVVSQRMPTPGTNDALNLLERSGTPLLRTWQRGAVRCEWRADAIFTEGFLDQQDPPRSGSLPGK